MHVRKEASIKGPREFRTGEHPHADHDAVKTRDARASCARTCASARHPPCPVDRGHRLPHFTAPPPASAPHARTRHPPTPSSPLPMDRHPRQRPTCRRHRLTTRTPWARALEYLRTEAVGPPPVLTGKRQRRPCGSATPAPARGRGFLLSLLPRDGAR